MVSLLPEVWIIMIFNVFESLLFLRWPYGPFLRDASLPGFLYCLKYPGFGCLHCAGWSLRDIHEICYREQCRRLLMLSNRSHAYLGVFLIGAQQHFKSQTYEQTRAHICIALNVLCRSHLLSAMIGRLCTIPACYWSNYFGCFRQY